MVLGNCDFFDIMHIEIQITNNFKYSIGLSAQFNIIYIRSVLNLDRSIFPF